MVRGLSWARTTRGVAAVLGAVLILTATPVAAHDPDELDAWLDEWQQQATVAFTTEVLAEWLDMAVRHPWQFGRFVATIQTARQGVPRPPRAYGAGVEQWRGLVAAYFPAGQVDTALCIIRHESGGAPTADNPTSSAAGLWQHLGKYWQSRSAAAGVPGSSIWDPEAATIVAAWLWRTGGWTHWVVWRRCV